MTAAQARKVVKAARLEMGKGDATKDAIRSACRSLRDAADGLVLVAREDMGEFEGIIRDMGAEGMRTDMAALRRSVLATIAGEDKAARWAARKERSKDAPEIVIGTDMEETLDASIAALHARGEIYQRGAMLVHLARDITPPDDSGFATRTWDPDAPTLRAVKPARLRVAMSSAATWMRADPKVGLVSALPPQWAVDAVMAHDEWPFKRAQGISEIPILRADGSLHDVPGFDPVSGYIYQPPAGFFMGVVNAPLTQGLAREAYARLCEPFHGFPFADPWHLSAAVSCLLSLIARPAIDGPVPMFPFLSTTPKSGKSMMVETIHLLATGREIPRMSPGATEEETEKRITMIAISARPCVLFDNLTGTFGGPQIDAAVQARVWSGRLLGASEEVITPIRTIWTVTGNNLAIKGDLAQRVIPIQLAPDCERPELRTGFRIPNLRAYARDPVMRAQVLSAAFSLLRAHAIAGRPLHGTLGGYDDWNAAIRSALVWAGAPDPGLGIAPLVDVADERRSQMKALLETWHMAFSSEVVYLADLQPHYTADRHGPLFGVVKSMAAGKDGHPDYVRLAYLLRAGAGRIYGGYRLNRSEETRHGARGWTVSRVG